MERRRWLLFAIFTCLIVASTSRELRVKQKLDLPIYNQTLAMILVEYASAVYMSDLTELFTWTCSRCNDLTKGMGFEVIELIVDIQNCLQAFVGVSKDLDAIVIAFRGTKERSIMNWIEDLYWKQLDLNYPGISDAMVCVYEMVQFFLFIVRRSKVYIYSSGSRLAQRLLFGNTNYGDLRKYLCGFFDTTIGNKKESTSYVEITQSVGVDKPSDILFVTDVLQGVAAKAAGLEVIISVRPGNAPLPDNHGFKTITSFSEI